MYERAIEALKNNQPELAILLIKQESEINNIINENQYELDFVNQLYEDINLVWTKDVLEN